MMRIQLLCGLFLGVIAAALIAQPAVASPSSAAPGPAPTRAEFIEIVRSSLLGPLIEALERNFPEETRSMLDRSAQVVRDNWSDPNAAIMLSAQEIQRFHHAKAALAINATMDDLLAFARARLAFYEAVQGQDIRACARIAQSGAVMDDIPPSLRERAMQLTVMMINTSGSGSRRAHVSGRGELAAAEASDWARVMSELDPSGQVSARARMANPIAGTEPAFQCLYLLTKYRAIVALPPETGANVFAYVIAREFSATDRTEQIGSR